MWAWTARPKNHTPKGQSSISISTWARVKGDPMHGEAGAQGINTNKKNEEAQKKIAKHPVGVNDHPVGGKVKKICQQL